jgi:hypothetical protein
MFRDHQQSNKKVFAQLSGTHHDIYAFVTFLACPKNGDKKNTVVI